MIMITEWHDYDYALSTGSDYDYDYDFTDMCNRLQSIMIVIVISPRPDYMYIMPRMV